MTNKEIMDITQEIVDFESYSKRNGEVFWYASDLMKMLGYESMQSFKKVINKAMRVCETLDIGIDDNFRRISDPGNEVDYKLSRFASYLVAMNGDVKKRQVAQVQAYFITYTEAFIRWEEQENAVDRIYIRSEITDHERSLSGVAKDHGIEQYQLFQNAGYRGLYNMNLSELRNYKGIPAGRTLLDYMGKAELAANLFRITQTEEKIRNEGITGQQKLEAAASSVGREVRCTMKRISGTSPEDLPIEVDIKQVKKQLKQTHKGMLKTDNEDKKK